MPLLESGKYNKIPEELMPKIPDVPTTVYYEFLYKFYNPADRKWHHKANEQVSSLSVVSDPTAKTKKFIPIGLVGGVDDKGNLNHTEIRQLSFQPEANGGLIILNIGDNRAADDELFQFLEMSSENESNPNRDKNVKPIFRRKDFGQEARKDREERAKRREAEDLVRGLKGKDLAQFAYLLGIDPNREDDLVLNDLEDKATSDPKLIIALSNDPDKPAKTLLVQGLANGTFKIDEEGGQITHENGAPILKVTGVDRDIIMNEFAAHIRDSKDSKKVLTSLQTLVDSKDKK